MALKKLIVLSLFLCSVLLGDELADALMGNHKQPKEKAAQLRMASSVVDKTACDKKVIDALVDNNISYFKSQKENLKSVNECFVNGDMSPVMLAAYIDRPNILAMFLNAGIDVNEKTAKLYSALHFAAFYGNYEAVQMLLSKGADINAQNDAGQTALMIAASYGNAKTAKLLLSKKADDMIRDRTGYTAKELAAKNNRKEALAVFGR